MAKDIKNDKRLQKQIVDITNKKRTREDHAIQFTEGENSKYLAHAIEIFNLPKVDLNDAEQVKSRIVEYLNICLRNDMRPNIEGVSNALACSRQYLWEISNGKTNKCREVVDTIKKVQYMLTQQMADFMQNGKINPVAAIFLMKNNMGYKDEQEIIVSPGLDEKQPKDLITEAQMLDDK